MDRDSTVATGSNPDITVVIVTFKTPLKVIQSCLSHVWAAFSADESTRSRVLILENGETDYRSLLRMGSDDQCICTGGNSGFAVTANFGLRQVRTGLTLFLNPDARISSDTLVKLREAHDVVGDASLLTCWLVKDGTVQVDAYMSWSFSVQRLLRRRKYARYLNDGASRSVVKVEKATGGALYAHTCLLRELGPFDEDYFLYGEDDDLSRRAVKLGFNLYTVPAAVASHDGGGSSEGVGALVERARVDATLRVISKHHGRFAVAVGTMDLALITVLGLFARSTSSSSRRGRWSRLHELRRWLKHSLRAPRFDPQVD